MPQALIHRIGIKVLELIYRCSENSYVEESVEIKIYYVTILLPLNATLFHMQSV